VNGRVLRREEEERLSYRSFARDAGLGAPNYLKLVIDGKRNLSETMAQRFAKACRLNEEASEYFRILVAFNQASDDQTRNELHDRLARFSRFRSSQRLDLAQKRSTTRAGTSRPSVNSSLAATSSKIRLGSPKRFGPQSPNHKPSKPSTSCSSCSCSSATNGVDARRPRRATLHLGADAER
jgi:hypothetical protein